MASILRCTRAQLFDGTALVCAAAAASEGVRSTVEVVSELSAATADASALARALSSASRSDSAALLGVHDRVLVPALAPLVYASTRGVDVGWLVANGGSGASRAGAAELVAARRALALIQSEIAQQDGASPADVTAADVVTASTLHAVLPFFGGDDALRPLVCYVEGVGRAPCWAAATATIADAARATSDDAAYVPLVSSNVHAVIRAAFSHGLGVLLKERGIAPPHAEALVQRNSFHSARGGADADAVDFQCNDVGRLVSLLSSGGTKKKKKEKQQKEKAETPAKSAGATPTGATKVADAYARASAPSPADLSRALLGHVPRVPLVADTTPSACGRFLNIRCDTVETARRVALLSKYGVQPVGAPRRAPRRDAIATEGGQQQQQRASKKVTIDYSSPNVAKAMHVGHLRSTMIGDALARLLEFQGSDVTRISHVGDWGGQFGMLIAQRNDVLTEGAALAALPWQSLDDEYRAAKARFVSDDGADAAFQERARAATLALQRGDAAARATWLSICNAAGQSRAALYARLGTDERLEEVGESAHVERIPTVLAELEGNGMLTLGERGARVVHVGAEKGAKKDPPPLMAVKSDGGWGYDSTDLAALQLRLVEQRSDEVLYVVDAGQALHFRALFSAARAAGWTRSRDREMTKREGGGEATLRHVRFGLVANADGKRMRSSGGETVALAALLDAARDVMESSLAAQRAAGAAPPALVEPWPLESTSPPALVPGARGRSACTVAERLAYDSVRYAELRQSRAANYTFELDRVLAADGDTNVYVQYTHARICSILRRADARVAGGDCIGAIHGRSSRSDCTPSGADPAENVRGTFDGDGGGAGGARVRLEHAAEVALASELLRYGEVVASAEAALAPHHLCELLHSVSARVSSFLSQCHVLPKESCAGGGTGGSGDGSGDGARCLTEDATTASRLVLIDATAVTMRGLMKLLGITPVERL